MRSVPAPTGSAEITKGREDDPRSFYGPSRFTGDHAHADANCVSVRSPRHLVEPWQRVASSHASLLEGLRIEVGACAKPRVDAS